MSKEFEPTTRVCWVKQECKVARNNEANRPGPRSGHTLNIIGMNGFLFGGIAMNKEDPTSPASNLDEFNLATASNDMYNLSLTSTGLEWRKIPFKKEMELPISRWMHSAVLYDNTQLIIFGGMHTHAHRLNDLWIFNIVDYTWRQPNPEHNKESSQPNQLQSKAWPNAPSARCGHSCTLIGENLYIFGGYGGQGFSRRELDDLYSLNLETMIWTKINAKGTPPEKRSGHQGLAIEKQLYVFGGWNNTTQFNDTYILDTTLDPPVWTRATNDLAVPTWNQAACSVVAIPTWKIFTFGGSTGVLNDHERQGKMVDTTYICDTGTGRWTEPSLEGDTKPCPRADTCLAYDAKGSRLIVFGGWSDVWHDDVYTLDVGNIVGPPYAITDMLPKMGPITGGTLVTILGIDFTNTQDVVVRFGNRRQSAEVKGTFVNQTKITAVSPDYTKFAPGVVDVRVALDGDSFTTTFQRFTYFSITNGANSLIYGAGLLSGCAVNEEVTFVIQSRDNNKEDRTTGGDEYQVTIELIGGGEEGENLKVMGVQVQDKENGQYVVSYLAKHAGTYHIDVLFMGTFGAAVEPVRGSDVTIVFDEFAPRDNNLMAGELVTANLKKEILMLEEFTQKISEAIFVKVSPEKTGEDQIRLLMSIRENLLTVTKRQDEITLVVDRSECIVKYLKEQDIVVPNIGEILASSKVLWEKIMREAPQVQAKISPLMRQHSAKIRADISAYEAKVIAHREELKKSRFILFATGVLVSFDLLDAADKLHQEEQDNCDKMVHVAQIFETENEIQETIKVMAEVVDLLKEYRQLWSCIKNIESVIDHNRRVTWAELEPEEFEDSAKSLVQSLRRLSKGVKASDAFKGADKKVKEFLTTCPLIVSLRSPAMRERHWREIMSAVKKEFTLPAKNPKMLLKELLDLNLHLHSNEIEEITDKAIKEAKHEALLANLETTWSTVEFSMNLYKDTDVPLLRLEDEIIEQLESDQMAVQSIVGGRYGHFKEQAGIWQKSLGAVSDVVMLLVELQRTWSYLEPLFIASDEVKKELPEDAKRFQKIDEQVRQFLQKAWKTRNVKQVCVAPGLFAKLTELNEGQEICRKSLSEFLDGKKRQFPRFYFTSEADLLDILSNSSQPVKVLKQIDKILLATKELVLNAPSGGTRPSAVSWVAGVGKEAVKFDAPVKLEGKAEGYLDSLLKAQIYQLSRLLTASNARYPEEQRSKWILTKSPDGECKDPAQIMLLVAAIDFTSAVEKALKNYADGDKKAPVKYYEQVKAQLAELIALTQASLSKGDRQRVMCMITMDAHNRDIIDVLIRENALKSNDFQWQSKLRPKYVIETKADSLTASIARFYICDAKFDYGFEYLGNGPRLVITPLTDRIYVTATQALNLKMGCAPAGPAGTGKTESTKDLASALGKCCYVFNCSPEMDYRSMGDIFKGLAASGSWGCFDEFNRLIPEVLSVCSVQFKAVCDGLKGYDETNIETARVTIEGDTVNLDPTCGAFITMNPGYLGRSELPEGLKALFRPITVIVPDLVLICENMLMAEGFLSAKVLASKFYGLYSLLSELLSKQAHYDWGLRAVKSVLVVAGQLKRAEPELDEDALLMRALRDFNIPKIVAMDEVVFFGLLNDLFPDLNPPRVFDEELSECVQKACEETGLWPDPFFTLKVMQLDELLDIRHCVFIMGPTGSGKSSSWKMLQAARNIRTPDAKVKTVDLNPKTMPTEELYGFISMATREWKDGLLSSIMRDVGKIPNEHPKWIILDGDLDANWIESMNSVMDDNKMLTLASNERIPLKSYMRMIFEIRDLKYATPATVSRAGILYISMDGGSQWRSIVGSWVRSRPEELLEDPDREKIHAMFERYLPDTLKYFATSLEGVVNFNDVSIVLSTIKFLDVILNRNIVMDEATLETAFVFCLIWGCGSILTISDDGTDYKTMFSNWFRTKFKAVKIPSRDTIFDYWLDPKTNKFESWKACPSFREVEFDSTVSNMIEVTVPTPETASVSYWMDMLVKNGNNVMLAGGAGTGKTQLVNGMLSTLKPEAFISCSVNMNYYSSASILLTSLETPLQKRTGSLFGPPGSAKLIYFVDDLNLPMVDKYGTQSAISLIRQHIDYGHWYDMQKLTVKNVADCNYVAALNPTAGSFHIDPRLQRHFTTFAVNMPSASSLMTIYETFLAGHLTSQGFNTTVSAVTSSLIKAALSVHKEVTENFRKTAANFHYEFNIRHIANVFQGLLVSIPGNFKEMDKFVYLWMHESERVYGDRLVNYDDQNRFKNILATQAKRAFPACDVNKFYLTGGGVKADPLMFCHFADGATSGEDLIYDQALNLEDVRHTLETALTEYNETNVEMNLVLFDDALLHIARIVRIIKQSGGHALLVGVGGMGKQSLSRLSSFICGYNLMQILVNQTYGIQDFKADLQAMYQKAGVKQEGVLFLLTDTQISNEKFFVYLNDLLSSGNIPDLYTKDEKEAIINQLTNKAKGAGYSAEPAAVWSYFISKIRENLHCCLCFSPVGEGLRVRARRFPALASCTVIDWFQPWPQQALESVGKQLLKDTEELATDLEILQAIESFMPNAFVAVNQACKKFLQTDNKYVYTTPKSYLEMVKLYQVFLKKKWQETDAKIYRLANGVEKLTKAAEDVVVLEAKLQTMLVEAEEKGKVAAGIASKVQKEKAIVEAENAKARIEAQKVTAIQNDVAAQQASAEEDLAQAEPALLRAMAALDSLNARDLGNCKTMSKPPPGVDDIFGGVMVLLAGLNPNIIVQKSGRVRDKERTWDHAKKALLGNVNAFLEELKGFKNKIDEGLLPEVNMKEIRPFLQLEHFDPEVIEKRNSAAAGLCSWTLNIVTYYDIVLLVEPKRIALREANEKLSEANEQLEVVRSKVAELQAKLDELTIQFNAAEKDRLEAQEIAEKGRLKLELANRLTAALGSEEDRWKEGIQSFTQQREMLVGDCLLASAFISYIGPFTKDIRVDLINNVLTPLLTMPKVGKSIPMTENVDPIEVIVSEAEIAVFQTEGLPSDKVSAENAAIVLSSVRYPLLIDPQLQAITWIKKKEEKTLKLGRLGQSNLIKELLRAIEDGVPFLIENMGESIDPSLMPIISRMSIKRGSKKFIQIGDAEVEINPAFRLYLHTKLNNPHYPPEIQAETTMVNFSVTQKGLEEQLLGLVVRFERPDLAAQRSALIMQQNLFTIRVQQLEDNILRRLAEAKGDITEDRALIEELELSKKIADEIAIKLVESRVTSTKIEETSEQYRPVARRGALLFFVMNKMVKMHTYYMFSLSSFIQFFLRGIFDAGKETNEPSRYDPQFLRDTGGVQETDLNRLGEDIEKRVEEINLKDSLMANSDMGARLDLLKQSVSLVVFNFLRMGLFEKDKLTVATLVCMKVLIDEGKLDRLYLDVMMRSRAAEDVPMRGVELSKWLTESAWCRLKGIEEDLLGLDPVFSDFTQKISQDAEDWEEWYNHADPETKPMPGDYKDISPIARLVILRVLRPDRLPTALSIFIKDHIGDEFVTQPPFNMDGAYEYTSNNTPVLFVLYPGVDPTSWVEALGKRKGMTQENGTFANISMGQGQEARADKVVADYARDGGWVFLQNVHLMQTWLPALMEKLEMLEPHENFRVFISAEPPALSYLKNIPEGLLQTCITISEEPPSDLKANLARCWTTFSQQRINKAGNPANFKACLFGLSFFHSLMLGRKKYGGQGWSRAYGFNMGDLRICSDVLESYLNATPKSVPWQDLRYIFGEIMYGGHITDFFDRRTNNTYLSVIFKDTILKRGQLAPGLTSPDSKAWEYDRYNEMISNELPPESPLIYGLHPNAEIGFLSNKAETLFETIQTLEVGASDTGDGGGIQEAVRTTLDDLLTKCPESFELVGLGDRAKERVADSDGPFVIVALQECSKMNALLEYMKLTLDELLKGLNGQLNMSQNMEDMALSMSLNMVPGRNPFHGTSWEKLAWASRKSLSSWFADVLSRRAQLQTWQLSLILPYSIWISGLINPTAFLTAVKQVTARKNKLPLDNMSLDTSVTCYQTADAAIAAEKYPEDGAFVHGLLMEGARWSTEEEAADDTYDVSGTKCAGHLKDSKLKQLLTALPVIYVKAVSVQPDWSPEAVGYLRGDPKLYECPVYVTGARGPTFVFLATLKTVDPVHKWILAGCALLMQSDE